MIEANAIITNGTGRFSLETINVFPPQGDEVQVEMKAAGICHTDYDSLNWEKELIMGHEGAGIVKAVGKKVKTVTPGDSVILNWAIPCGKCFQCSRGNTAICETQSPVTNPEDFNTGHAAPERTTFNNQPILRSFNLGTMSSHTVVKAAAVVKTEIGIPFSSACIVGCGVMTGLGSVLNIAKVKPGSSVVVLGAGGVGLNVIQGAKIAGAQTIIAIDINESRLEMSKQFGATHQILTQLEDKNLEQAHEKVLEITNRGADYAFECTGVPALGAVPLLMIRNAGMAVQVSGIEEEITIDMSLFEWDKMYINPLYGKCNPNIDFPKIINFYKNEKLLLDELVTRTYPLQNLQQAFDDMLTGKNAKGVIVFE